DNPFSNAQSANAATVTFAAPSPASIAAAARRNASVSGCRMVWRAGTSLTPCSRREHHAIKMGASRTAPAGDDSVSRLDEELVGRLYARAGAERWGVTRSCFAQALAASLHRADVGDQTPSGIERYLASLHLEDLALACACATGSEAAWDHFIAEHRPVLY